jgi:hypothetical protein
MNTPIVKRPLWQQMLQGFEITGIAIRDKATLQLVAKKALPADEASHVFDSEIPTRIASIFLNEPVDDNIECQELHGMAYPKVGVSRAPFPRPGGLVASLNSEGDVWPLGGGNGPAEQISPGGWPGVSRLKCLWGYTYCVGGSRDIFKRVAVGQWERDNRIPEPKTKDEMGVSGFNDLDAFSESDMYAVGGHGDIWHFNGSAWRQMGFPTNEQLATVTCAGDGNVYITSEGGSLWVGQKSTWRLLQRQASSVLCNDAVWFDGQLWMGSDYALRVWDGKAIVPPTHEGRTILASGHVDAYDGLLAVADLWNVSTFDGKTWRRVVAPYKDGGP